MLYMGPAADGQSESSWACVLSQLAASTVVASTLDQAWRGR